MTEHDKRQADKAQQKMLQAELLDEDDDLPRKWRAPKNLVQQALESRSMLELVWAMR